MTGNGQEPAPARSNGSGLDGSRFNDCDRAPGRSVDKLFGLLFAGLTDGEGNPALSARVAAFRPTRTPRRPEIVDLRRSYGPQFPRNAHGTPVNGL